MPIHNKLALSTLALALTGSGCVAHAHATSSFEATADADASGPELVLVSPDIWVVEDHDEAVFFYADAYWTTRGGVWYRSEVHTGGWVQVTVVPTVIVHITRPEVYVHYHGPKHAKRRGHKHKHDEHVYARPAPHQDEPQGHDRPGREDGHDKYEKKDHDYEGRGKKHGNEKKEHEGHAYRGHGPKGKDKKGNDGKGRDDHKHGDKKSKGPDGQH